MINSGVDELLWNILLYCIMPLVYVEWDPEDGEVNEPAAEDTSEDGVFLENIELKIQIQVHLYICRKLHNGI